MPFRSPERHYIYQALATIGNYWQLFGNYWQLLAYIVMEKTNYYNIEEDITAFPDATFIFVVGGNSSGKTYGALKSCYNNKRKFVFVKRTNDDVKLMCAGTSKKGSKLNLSPFTPLNRDMNINVNAYSIARGIGEFREDNSAIGNIVSLNSVRDIRGMDMSDCDWVIFDEFIPLPWERIDRKEGSKLVNLYTTIMRDRLERGRDNLKLICLANAGNISNPVFSEFNLIDNVYELCMRGNEFLEIPERHILVHMLPRNKYVSNYGENDIYDAMKGTQWEKMSRDNEFAYNDMPIIPSRQLKNFKCICSFLYKNKNWYVYKNGRRFYVCDIRGNSAKEYDLEKTADCVNFEIVRDGVWISFLDGCAEFSSLSIFELFKSYKQIVKLYV